MTESSQSFQSVRRLIRQGDLTAATGVAQGLNGFESLVARGLLAVEENQEQALVLSEQALAHSRLDVNEENTAWALWLNGRAQAAFGDIESAVLSMQRAHRLFGDANCVVYALESQCWSASFVERMGDARQAVAMYESVMGSLELLDEPWARGLMLLTQGHYFRLKGLLSIAEDHYEQARAFFQAQGWHLLAQESLFDP